MEKVYEFTSSAFERLNATLVKLQKEDMERVTQKIAEAKSFGDLSENAEYDAARDEQAKLQARIDELRYVIDHSQVIEASDSEIGIGSLVMLKCNGDDMTVELANDATSDLLAVPPVISDESPIGNMIKGKKVGDVFEVELYSGKTVTVEILDIAVAGSLPA